MERNLKHNHGIVHKSYREYAMWSGQEVYMLMAKVIRFVENNHNKRRDKDSGNNKLIASEDFKIILLATVSVEDYATFKD